MQTSKTPNSNRVDLSIIIVNYKSEHYLDKCLASIYRESRAEQFEIIIVNNDQAANLAEIVKKYPKAAIFNCEKNIGFGRACNYGAKKALGGLLLFLNPDTQFLNDYAQHVVNKFEKSAKKIGIIGPKLLTDEGQTQAWCTGKDLTLGQRVKNKFWIVESRKLWESQKEIMTDWVSGAALTIKKELFEKIEGFDENFFMYGEDLDLCAKIRDLGYTILYCPETAILHSGGKSRENLLKQKLQFFKSSFYYIIKRMRHR